MYRYARKKSTTPHSTHFLSVKANKTSQYVGYQPLTKSSNTATRSRRHQRDYIIVSMIPAPLSKCSYFRTTRNLYSDG